MALPLLRIFLPVAGRTSRRRPNTLAVYYSFGHSTRRQLHDTAQQSGQTVLDIIKVPLSQSIQGLPTVVYPKPPNSREIETKVTVLSNGLRVASEKKFGQFCIAGVAVRAGSRLEGSYPSGVSHFVERSAFKSTSKYESKEQIMELLSQVGGTVDCQGSRDLTVYAVSVLNQHLEVAVDLLSETVLRPQLNNVKETAARIAFELQDMTLDPERKVQLTEMIHKAAYGNQGLGLPKICPPSNLDAISPEIIFNYLKNTHRPDKMVIAGVGMEHEELVALAKKYFLDKSPIWDENSAIASPTPVAISDHKSTYTGGIVTVEEDLSNVSLGPTPLPNLAHFILGFEVCSHLDLDEFVIVCVMNMLMGGGGSFSAGGPGKGMFTRLFTNILNRHHWVHSSAALNSSYDDSGLFYIQSSSEPSQLKNLVDVVIHEFRNIVHGRMSSEELARAKKQLISMLWLNLEIRPIVFEDIARQVLSCGFRRQPWQLIEKIEQVTEQDIKRIAEKMLNTKPSVACLGDLTNLPSFEYITNAIRQ